MLVHFLCKMHVAAHTRKLSVLLALGAYEAPAPFSYAYTTMATLVAACAAGNFGEFQFFDKLARFVSLLRRRNGVVTTLSVAQTTAAGLCVAALSET